MVDVFMLIITILLDTVTLLLTSLDDQGTPIDITSTMKPYLKRWLQWCWAASHLEKCQHERSSTKYVPVWHIPLHLTSNNEVIWKNPSPNSADSLRPVFLMHEKENDQELLTLVIPNTDNARTNLKMKIIKLENENGINVNYKNQNMHLHIDIKDTMKDLKLKCSISGLRGIDCIICVSKTDGWTNPTNIRNRFLIDRNLGPFRRFSMHMWQNARTSTVRHAMVCDVYFPFSKIL